MRLAIIGIAILFVFGAWYYMPPSDLTPVGGRWATHYSGSWSMDAHGTKSLYRRAWFGFPLRIANDVHVRRFYPPDCLLWDDGRMTTLHAACGSGMSFVVAQTDAMGEDRYEATAEGLRRAVDMREENGIPMWTVERIPITNIRAKHVDPIVSREPVDVTYRDERGMTPLHRAAIALRADVVVALLRAGADVNAADSRGVKPIQIAADVARPDTGVLHAVLAGGPDLEVLDVLNQTPLLRAAMSNDTVVFRMLLAKGADPCKRDGKGETIVDLASADLPKVRDVMRSAYRKCAGPAH
jgi:hypothetical protein